MITSSFMLALQNTESVSAKKWITLTTSKSSGIDVAYHEDTYSTNGNIISALSSPPYIEITVIYPVLLYTIEISFITAAVASIIKRRHHTTSASDNNKYFLHKQFDLLYLSTKSAISSTLHINSFFFMFVLFVTALQSGINEAGEDWDYFTAVYNFFMICKENIMPSISQNITEIEKIATAVYTTESTAQLNAWAASIMFITGNIVRQTYKTYRHLNSHARAFSHSTTNQPDSPIAVETKFSQPSPRAINITARQSLCDKVCSWFECKNKEQDSSSYNALQNRSTV